MESQWILPQNKKKKKKNNTTICLLLVSNVPITQHMIYQFYNKNATTKRHKLEMDKSLQTAFPCGIYCKYTSPWQYFIYARFWCVCPFFDIRKGLTESNDSELNGKIKYKPESVLNFQNKQNIETTGDEILSFRFYCCVFFFLFVFFFCCCCCCCCFLFLIYLK